MLEKELTFISIWPALTNLHKRQCDLVPLNQNPFFKNPARKSAAPRREHTLAYYLRSRWIVFWRFLPGNYSFIAEVAGDLKQISSYPGT